MNVLIFYLVLNNSEPLLPIMEAVDEAMLNSHLAHTFNLYMLYWPLLACIVQQLHLLNYPALRILVGRLAYQTEQL